YEWKSQPNTKEEKFRDIAQEIRLQERTGEHSSNKQRVAWDYNCPKEEAIYQSLS
ncbi:unnamed protein product, partial [marine sediment metagenome]